jgi:hypothetical protein
VDPDYSQEIAQASLLFSQALLAREQGLKEQALSLDGKVRRLLQQLGLAITTQLYRALAAQVTAEAAAQGLPVERRTSIPFTCVFGTLEVESPYLYHPPTRRAARPVKEILGLRAHGRSLTVERALTDFGAEESFGQAVVRFEEHYGFAVGRTTELRVVETRAEQAEHYVKTRLEREEKAFEEPLATRPGKDQLLCELDGCELRTGVLRPAQTEERTEVRKLPKRKRQEEWRESRVGLVRELSEVEKTYVAKMDKYPAVVRQLFGAAVSRGMSSRTEVISVCDGGNGLREELHAQFPRLKFILDEPHLKEHLYEGAEAKGLAGEAREAWVCELHARLSQGGAPEVVKELLASEGEGAERLVTLGKHLSRFQDAVSYDAYRAAGLPCGSGEVESAHRYIPQKRLKIQGACWHPRTINPMLGLRILRANGWWDDFWKEQAKAKCAA